MGAGMGFISGGIGLMNVGVLFLGASLVGIGYNGGEVYVLLWWLVIFCLMMLLYK